MSNGRLTIRIASVTLVLFSLVCGMQPPVTRAAGSQVELQFLVSSGSADQTRAWQQLIRLFHEKNPDIRVRYQILPPMDIEQKVMTAATGGVSLDAAWWATASYSKFAWTGLLEPLNSHLEPGILPRLFPSFVNAVSVKNSLFGLPATASPNALFYNMDLFDAAGVTPPTANDDWQGFVDKMKKLTKQRGDGTVSQWGFTFFSGVVREWLNWIWQNGGDLFAPDGNAVVVDQAPAAEAVQFLSDLSNVHRVSPPGPELRGPIWDTFFSGRSAVYPSGAWDVYLINESRLPIDAAPYPKRKAATVAVESFIASVLKTSKHPKEAARLAAFIAGDPEAQKILYAGGWGIPTNMEVASKAWIRPDTPLREELFIQILASGDWRFVPYGPRWLDTEGSLLDTLWQVNDGKVPAQTALRNFKEAADSILAK